ncbi:Uncharacterised protein [Afipia felis]|uniref:Uncharacterized protein n=2 Tax=Afipia felis TaxID=1035 RepID=A0A380WCV7_AFIFE|nr:hypothetical protein HMPREF9697_01723 [Afipia felis ATCC 53690]SUU77902.1 Uncharacterised protein [Afipia felis]SUU85967.1 Uncharacterised protein [Afipia felis]
MIIPRFHILLERILNCAQVAAWNLPLSGVKYLPQIGH